MQLDRPVVGDRQRRGVVRRPASDRGPAGLRRTWAAPPAYAPSRPAGPAEPPAQPGRVQQLEQAALHQEPLRPARPGAGTRRRLTRAGSQSGRLGVDHAGGGLLQGVEAARSAAASPPRSRSVRRCSRSCAPEVPRSARRTAGGRAAPQSAGPGADSRLAAAACSAGLASTRPRRASSHGPAQSAGSPCWISPSPEARRRSSPNAWWQGSLLAPATAPVREPVVSSSVLYGLLPLRLHSPYTAPEPAQPVPDWCPADASLFPALRDASSGARDSTCSTVQRGTDSVAGKGSPP
ncbi:hypothetical protein SMICM304S_08197 [Streptomyces microflavus]